jgi:Fasciclin domain
MRIQHLPHLILLTSLTSVSTSHLILPNHFQQALTEPAPPPNDIQISIIMPVLPSSDKSQTPSSSPNSHSPTLYDTLPLTRRINIFSSLLRDHPDMSKILSESPQSTSQSTSQNRLSNLNITILAPLNSAMQSLPHKPWESPQDYQNLGERAYDGESGQERAQRNLRSFVEGHVVPRGAAEWGEGVRVETLAGGGRELWWESREEGKEKKKNKVIMPDGVEVEGVESKATNGEVWVLKGVLKV